MVFSSLTFLLLFLPATLAGYALLRKLFPKTLLPVNLLLCLFSLLFYRWGAGWAEVALLLALAAVNYLAAYVRRQTGSRLPLVLGVAFDCAVLLRFKYPALVLAALQAAPASGAGLEGAVIPLGLSFTVFHAISFLVDEARDEDNLSASAPPPAHIFVSCQRCPLPALLPQAGPGPHCPLA